MFATYQARGLALIRIGVGVYFLLEGAKKLAGGWLADGGPVVDFIQKNLPQSELVYRPFLEREALPHADLFAQLVAFGECAVGLSLLLGLLTRLGGLAAMFLVANYILAKGVPAQVNQSIVSTDWLFFVAALGCVLGRAGLVWGLDGAWRHTLAANPVTRWLAGIPSRPTVTLTVPATGRLARILHLRVPRRRAS